MSKKSSKLSKLILILTTFNTIQIFKFDQCFDDVKTIFTAFFIGLWTFETSFCPTNYSIKINSSAVEYRLPKLYLIDPLTNDIVKMTKTFLCTDIFYFSCRDMLIKFMFLSVVVLLLFLSFHFDMIKIQKKFQCSSSTVALLTFTGE